VARTAAELAKLRDERVALVSEVQRVATLADVEKRELTADEKTGVAQRTARASEVLKIITDEGQALAAEREWASALERVGPLLHTPDVRPSERVSDREFLRRIASGPKGMGADIAAPVDQVMSRARASARAITVYGPTATPTVAPSSAAGSSPAGVAVTGLAIVEQIVANAFQISTIMQRARTITASDGREHILPLETGRLVGQWLGERQPIPDTGPGFSTVTLRAFGYKGLSALSQELLVDEQFDLVGYLSRAAGRDWGDAVNRAFLVGDGVIQPQGLLPNAAVGNTIASAAALKLPDLLALRTSVISPFRTNAVWMVSPQVEGLLYALTDLQNRPLFVPGYVASAPDTFMGSPIVVDPGVPYGVGVIAGFGDIERAYTALYAGGMRIDRSDDARFETFEAVFRYVQRVGGAVINPQAFKTLKASAV